jgi:hypothetical protein
MPPSRSSFGADFVLVGHFAFVIFAVAGGSLILLDLRWAWLHIPAVLWSSIVNLANWTCPLTPLETSLRRQAGQAGYSGGFIHHYVGKLVYPGGMPRRMELIAGFSIVIWNALLYAVLLEVSASSSSR